jgi:hypothetical protein
MAKLARGDTERMLDLDFVIAPSMLVKRSCQFGQLYSWAKIHSAWPLFSSSAIRKTTNFIIDDIAGHRTARPCRRRTVTSPNRRLPVNRRFIILKSSQTTFRRLIETKRHLHRCGEAPYKMFSAFDEHCGLDAPTALLRQGKFINHLLARFRNAK